VNRRRPPRNAPCTSPGGIALPRGTPGGKGGSWRHAACVRSGLPVRHKLALRMARRPPYTTLLAPCIPRAAHCCMHGPAAPPAAPRSMQAAGSSATPAPKISQPYMRPFSDPEHTTGCRPWSRSKSTEALQANHNSSATLLNAGRVHLKPPRLGRSGHPWRCHSRVTRAPQSPSAG
jgi:hypothetical protein